MADMLIDRRELYRRISSGEAVVVRYGCRGNMAPEQASRIKQPEAVTDDDVLIFSSRRAYRLKSAEGMFRMERVQDAL